MDTILLAESCFCFTSLFGTFLHDTGALRLRWLRQFTSCSCLAQSSFNISSLKLCHEQWVLAASKWRQSASGPAQFANTHSAALWLRLFEFSPEGRNWEHQSLVWTQTFSGEAQCQVNHFLSFLHIGRRVDSLTDSNLEPQAALAGQPGARLPGGRGKERRGMNHLHCITKASRAKREAEDDPKPIACELEFLFVRAEKEVTSVF